MLRHAIPVLLLACGAATTPPDEPEDILVSRYAIEKTLLSNNCPTAPTLTNQTVTVDLRTAGRIELDDGNGKWRGTITPQGVFNTEERRGTLADGTTLVVTLTGRVTATRFEGRLDATRGTVPPCQYAITWAGNLVPASATSVN